VRSLTRHRFLAANFCGLMSTFGPSRHLYMSHLMSLSGGKADMTFCTAHVCF
jgi:hypothetical protein